MCSMHQRNSAVNEQYVMAKHGIEEKDQKEKEREICGFEMGGSGRTKKGERRK